MPDLRSAFDWLDQEPPRDGAGVVDIPTKLEAVWGKFAVFVRTAQKGKGSRVMWKGAASEEIERLRLSEESPGGDAKAIEQLWRSFADLGQFEDHALDVADLDPEEVADLVDRRLQAGLLTI